MVYISDALTTVLSLQVTEQGCNPNDRDLDGASCLHFAATNGRAAVVAWMIKTGKAKVSLDNLGGSPLHNAAELGHYEVSVCAVRDKYVQ